MKKQIPSYAEVFKDLTLKVLSVIGLDVDNYGYILDQDTGAYIMVANKPLKYMNIGDTIDPTDKVLDVIHDYYTLNFLTSYFISKLSEEDSDFYIVSFNSYINKMENTSCMMYKGCINISTRYYKSESLKYIEGLYRLDGNDIDLTIYDEIIQYYLNEEMKMNKKGLKW